MTLVPCPTCPWRKSSTVGGFDIPGFDLDKMRNLRCTIPPPEQGFATVMACHYSEEGEEKPCLGYVAQINWSSLTLRLMAMRERIDLIGIMEACQGLDLWDNFEDMLAAYEEAWG